MARGWFKSTAPTKITQNVMVPLPDRAVRCRIEITFIYSDYAEANRRSKQHFISADASNEEESSKKLTL